MFGVSRPDSSFTQLVREESATDYATFNHVYTYITSAEHTAMVILLNQATQGVLQTVFWYKPQIVRERVQLCHPSVWDHAKTRTDALKLEHLTLLSCCSADER